MVFTHLAKHLWKRSYKIFSNNQQMVWNDLYIILSYIILIFHSENEINPLFLGFELCNNFFLPDSYNIFHEVSLEIQSEIRS